MRDPRLSSPSSSSPSGPRPQRVHQDVLPPPHQPAYHPSQPSTYAAPPPPPGMPYHSSSYSHHSSSRPPHPYYAAPPPPRQSQLLRQYPDQPQYYYDPSRGQTFLAVPVEDAPRPAPPRVEQPQPQHRVYVLSNTSTFWPDELGEEENVERTCECLTSSVNCHGCGRTVGYHIVSPCTRCSASVQKHQKTANHHRYVFHHNEVRARERLYYPGEAGVLSPLSSSSSSSSGGGFSSRSSSPSPRRSRERERDEAEKEASSAVWDPRLMGRSPLPGRGAAQDLAPLREGSALYWHHLVPGGERSKPVDPRTRDLTVLMAERAGR
ncbi:hypothetical protein JCM10213v2_006476 [Rhodosporidiobolus nylandii]